MKIHVFDGLGEKTCCSCYEQDLEKRFHVSKVVITRNFGTFGHLEFWKLQRVNINSISFRRNSVISPPYNLARKWGLPCVAFKFDQNFYV